MRSKKGQEKTKIILQGILMTGAIIIASTSPYFLPKVIPKIIKGLSRNIKDKKKEKSFFNTFYYLKKKGMINIENKGGQIYISLTKEGKKKVGKYQIDDLIIKRPNKWDKKWRILIFDIKDKQRIKREALRGKIKELGLCQLQKSVWVYPYDFFKEIDLLRSFFGITKEELKIIIASEIEDDKKIRNFFNLS